PARAAKPQSPALKKKENSSLENLLKDAPGVQRSAMPRNIHPMMATLVDGPFDDAEWLFEVKWDGYRALAYVEDGHVRLVSRNQNEFTDYPELSVIPKQLRAKTAILDGEIVALDEEGRSSFSLMQQRTGLTSGEKHRTPNRSLPIVYYV